MRPFPESLLLISNCCSGSDNVSDTTTYRHLVTSSSDSPKQTPRSLVPTSVIFSVAASVSQLGLSCSPSPPPPMVAAPLGYPKLRATLTPPFPEPSLWFSPPSPLLQAVNPFDFIRSKPTGLLAFWPPLMAQALNAKMMQLPGR